MRILISADMEGISGVCRWEQVAPGSAEYPTYQKLMTARLTPRSAARSPVGRRRSSFMTGITAVRISSPTRSTPVPNSAVGRVRRFA